MLRRLSHFIFLFLTGALVLLSASSHSLALTAEEIGVIANRRDPDSLSLARFYIERRNIPPENLITISVDPAETCERQSYDELIAAPIRKFLADHATPGKIKCLVTMYGVPLAITAPALSRQGEENIAPLTEKIEKLRATPQLFASSIAQLEKQISYQNKISDMRASVDSELTLLQDHPLSHWLVNPLFQGETRGFSLYEQSDVLLVSRLDGPSPEVVTRMIEDALHAEKKGLKGFAFFDARWPDPDSGQVDGYRRYDRFIHRAAEKIRKLNIVDSVVIDEKETLFQPGQELPAALYCGWYSLGNYIDAFAWQRGAVGYHIASSECTTLKKWGSRVWCKMMLEKGAAAVIGPTGEPYVDAFPPPDLFFSLLAAGNSLVESYFFSLPHLSWKMVLVGDPLYRPFAGNKP